MKAFDMNNQVGGTFESSSSSFSELDDDQQSDMVDPNLWDENKHDETEEIRQLVAKESARVRLWRRNVFLVLLAAGALVTTLTYVFLNQEDDDDFQTAFHQFASTIRESTEFHLVGLVDATNGLSEVFTSEAKKSNSTWPFVTLSSFNVYADHSRRQGSAELVVICPLVKTEQLELWAKYANIRQTWIDESFAALGESRIDLNPIPTSVYRLGRYKGKAVLISEEGFGENHTAPFWQMSPPPFDTSVVNYNALSIPEYRANYDAVLKSRSHVMGKTLVNSLIYHSIPKEEHNRIHGIDSHSEKSSVLHQDARDEADERPHSSLISPVFADLHDNGTSEIVAIIISILPWDLYLQNLLPTGVNGLYCVLQNMCGSEKLEFTYVINGNDATFLGSGQLHDRKYDDLRYDIHFDELIGNRTEYYGDGDCKYWISVYPSDEFQGKYNTNLPVICSSVVAITFFLMAATFFTYDWFVISKNKKVMEAAAKSNAIVSSLFPSTVRDRLYAERDKPGNDQGAGGSAFGGRESGSSGLKQFLDNGYKRDGLPEISNAIADLFPETTVMFADIAGFTAWSSAREPSQVFVLLETLYGSFDATAKQSRVFKVETIGDCYVAVAGLPDARKDHAVVMARFASRCLHNLRRITENLEVTLGPDTGELGMRIGLHSGPVTAGVLRGERARFQLFGDTVNTASRMESTSLKDKIHLSQETADLLVAAGKVSWVIPREDKVFAKGKGEMQTYWLSMQRNPKASSRSDSRSDSQSCRMEGEESLDKFADSKEELQEGKENSIDQTTFPSTMTPKLQRLVEWNCDVLLRLLRQVVACNKNALNLSGSGKETAEKLLIESEIASNARSHNVLDEVQDILALPDYHPDLANMFINNSDVDEEAAVQLKHYVTTIAALYPDNPFHNFEHASHVAMSTSKLLSRVVAPSNMESADEQELHHSTFGITSDPLTQFSCFFAALIHDVQHPGVSNAQLIKENANIATVYKGKSVAEQNSVDIAWDLLMHDQYYLLRRQIYTTVEGFKRFRGIVVNAVMATDILDKDLKNLRNARWDKAFQQEHNERGECPLAEAATVVNKTDINRKATIVIEHLIQASDVAHTMQHWHIYRKWNERLFEEMYKAFKAGRASADPSDTWYEGELGFFDHYIIPLAKKLQSCGVFGVSSDEYLNYAMKNRREWELRGREVVADMLSRFQRGHVANRTATDSIVAEHNGDHTSKSGNETFFM